MTKSEPRGFRLLFFPPQKMCFYLNTMYFFLTNLKDHLYYMPDSHVNWVYFHVLYSIFLLLLLIPALYYVRYENFIILFRI